MQKVFVYLRPAFTKRCKGFSYNRKYSLNIFYDEQKNISTIKEKKKK